MPLFTILFYKVLSIFTHVGYLTLKRSRILYLHISWTGYHMLPCLRSATFGICLTDLGSLVMNSLGKAGRGTAMDEARSEPKPVISSTKNDPFPSTKQGESREERYGKLAGATTENM